MKQCLAALSACVPVPFRLPADISKSCSPPSKVATEFSHIYLATETGISLCRRKLPACKNKNKKPRSASQMLWKHQEQLIRTPRIPVPEILTVKEYLRKKKLKNLLSPFFLLPEPPNSKRPGEAKPQKNRETHTAPSKAGLVSLCLALPLTVTPTKNKDLGMSVGMLGKSLGH